MKVIVTHDIDHLTFGMPCRDFFLPKFKVRAFIEWVKGMISFRTYLERMLVMPGQRMHRIPELMAFDSSQQVPSTFFIGMNRGKGLNYSRSRGLEWAARIRGAGFETAVHGNTRLSFEEILEEKEAFQKGIPDRFPGIRMHYLHLEEDTIEKLNRAGYRFDASMQGLAAPSRQGTIWEFPFQLMDTHILEGGKKWQTRSLPEALDETIRVVEQALDARLPYLVIIFHDCYFSSFFPDWANWYKDLISYLKSIDLEFVTFDQAIRELEGKGTGL